MYVINIYKCMPFLFNVMLVFGVLMHVSSVFERETWEVKCEQMCTWGSRTLFCINVVRANCPIFVFTDKMVEPWKQ